MKRVEDLKKLQEGGEINQNLKEIIPEMQYCNIRGKLNNGFIEVDSEEAKKKLNNVKLK